MNAGRPPASSDGPPDFVVAGNITRDLLDDGAGWRPGGAVVYAAAIARGLGRRPGVVTAATEDVARAAFPDGCGVALALHMAAESTSFRNLYGDGHRTQYLPATGESVPAATVPEAWRRSPVVLIGAVYHEIQPELVARFDRPVGVGAQGYLRTVDPDRRVRALPPRSWDAAPLLARARALFLSEEDAGAGPEGAAAIERWAALTPLLVVTDGAHGGRFHSGGVWRSFPAAPAVEVDPTGAGDSFAAAFLIALDEGATPGQAARFAAAASALAVEVVGPAAPDRAAVRARMARMPAAREDEAGPAG